MSRGLGVNASLDEIDAPRRRISLPDGFGSWSPVRPVPGEFYSLEWYASRYRDRRTESRKATEQRSARGASIMQLPEGLQELRRQAFMLSEFDAFLNATKARRIPGAGWPNENTGREAAA